MNGVESWFGMAAQLCLNCHDLTQHFANKETLGVMAPFGAFSACFLKLFGSWEKNITLWLRNGSTGNRTPPKHLPYWPRQIPPPDGGRRWHLLLLPLSLCIWHAWAAHNALSQKGTHFTYLFSLNVSSLTASFPRLAAHECRKTLGEYVTTRVFDYFCCENAKLWKST